MNYRLLLIIAVIAVTFFFTCLSVLLFQTHEKLALRTHKSHQSNKGFTFNFRQGMFQELLVGNNEWDQWYSKILTILPKYEINTISRVAGFIAQAQFESSSFTILTENLNYSEEALDKLFPKYFKNAGRVTSLYARKPEKIANAIYANRLGNGNESSGDGWMYRGKGIFQLRGKDEYTKFGLSLKKSPEQAALYLSTKEGALESACWIWKINNLNAFCDNKDIIGMTKKLSAGTLGLSERQKYFDHALNVLSK